MGLINRSIDCRGTVEIAVRLRRLVEVLGRHLDNYTGTNAGPTLFEEKSGRRFVCSQKAATRQSPTAIASRRNRAAPQKVAEERG